MAAFFDKVASFILMANNRYRSSDGHINGARGAVLLVSSLKLVKKHYMHCMQALQHNAFLEPNLAHNNVITIDTTIDTQPL